MTDSMALERPATAGPERTLGDDKRRQILDGARTVFLAQGYDGASMDAIAKTAGVSKGTLYVYFANKETLFEALISDVCTCLAELAFELPPQSESIENALIRIGRRYVARAISADHLSSIRMVIGATEKFPAFGQLLYAAGPGRGLDILTGYFTAWAERGSLSFDDARLAAADFQDLLVAGMMRRRLLTAGETPNEADLDAHVKRAVGNFLKLHGA